MSSRWRSPTDEDEARADLTVAYRCADVFGWTDLGGTHFSARVPGEDAYLVLALGLFFDEVTPENLVKVTFDGTVVGEGEVNPAGTTIHAGLYRATDAAAILHTHTRAGVAVANHPDGLLPLSQHALRFHRAFGVHAYEGVALDHDEGTRLAADLGSHELLLLRNHGLLTVGVDLPRAFSALYYAEVAAQMQVDSLAGGVDGVLPEPDVCERTKAQYDASAGYMYRDWLGCCRDVARRDPLLRVRS